MQIKMKQTVMGSPDPSYSRQYDAGDLFDIGADIMPAVLADVFIQEGWAEVVNDANETPAETASSTNETPAPKRSRRKK